ncbi:hypothetical protein FDP41_003139 [Naegleria fowleri]|uniref:COMM domain-containing protein n=1 Tax=Naegleria fowleri TaxID=5763 RepID=A0A6A5BLC0_NAEFO|nr:uncharacterized protein FDP41_003139 [Naegleria fowleri]KAF0977817.1 hypothetical protein FDP41_003139 [Naegleria fowleri]
MATIFRLQDDHLNDLVSINKLTTEQLEELCKLSVDFIISGSVKKSIQQTAASLSLDKDESEKTITSLSYLYSDCAKANLDSNKFQLTIFDIPSLSDIHANILLKHYEQNFEKFRTLFTKANSTESCYGLSTIPQYKDLEWRFEVECDRRSVRQLLEPYFTLKLITSTTTGDEKNTQAQYFNCSLHELKHMHDVLGEALKEMKSPHTRRIKYYIK